jgi:hypothetical protein
MLLLGSQGRRITGDRFEEGEFEMCSSRPYPRALVLLCALMGLSFCTELFSAAQEPPLKSDKQPNSEQPKEDRQKVVTVSPLTIDVSLDERTRSDVESVLADTSRGTVRLTIKIVVPAEPQNIQIAVFVNKPDATISTSVASAHYVGTIVFDAASKLQGVNFDLTAALSALQKKKELDLRNPLQITLIALPAREDAKIPADLSIPVDFVEVKVAKSKASPDK